MKSSDKLKTLIFTIQMPMVSKLVTVVGIPRGAPTHKFALFHKKGDLERLHVKLNTFHSHMQEI